MIRKIEELSMNAFPALETVHYDGWVIRISDGKSKRVNSVYALYPSTMAIDDKVEYCESLYDSLKMRRVFKLTDDTHCAGLDDLLRARGYSESGRTRIETLDLHGFDYLSDEEFEYHADFPRSWYLDLCSAEKRSELDKKVVAEAWKKVVSPQCYISLVKEGKRVAYGRGVMDQGYVGIYGIFVDPAWRRRGFGEIITKELIAYARRHGCYKAYLQVEVENESARRLYDKIGFREIYQYWYLLQEAQG